MNILFDAEEANKLVDQMYDFCEKIENDAINVLKSLNDVSNWNDNKKDDFEKNIYGIWVNLDEITKQQRQYADTFKEKIKELEG